MSFDGENLLCCTPLVRLQRGVHQPSHDPNAHARDAAGVGFSSGLGATGLGRSSCMWVVSAFRRYSRSAHGGCRLHVVACTNLVLCAGMNSGVMLFRRTPWMEEFLTKVAALGRIPEPALGKVHSCLPGTLTLKQEPLSCSLKSRPSKIAAPTL